VKEFKQYGLSDLTRNDCWATKIVLATLLVAEFVSFSGFNSVTIDGFPDVECTVFSLQ
jgi:hypothetical protein